MCSTPPRGTPRVSSGSLPCDDHYFPPWRGPERCSESPGGQSAPLPFLGASVCWADGHALTPGQASGFCPCRYTRDFQQARGECKGQAPGPTGLRMEGCAGRGHASPPQKSVPTEQISLPSCSRHAVKCSCHKGQRADLRDRHTGRSCHPDRPALCGGPCLLSWHQAADAGFLLPWISSRFLEFSTNGHTCLASSAGAMKRTLTRCCVRRWFSPPCCWDVSRDGAGGPEGAHHSPVDGRWGCFQPGAATDGAAVFVCVCASCARVSFLLGNAVETMAAVCGMVATDVRRSCRTASRSACGSLPPSLPQCVSPRCSASARRGWEAPASSILAVLVALQRDLLMTLCFPSDE